MVIARACMAMRNNNGGFLIIGIDDYGTCCDRPDWDVRRRFNPDAVQEIVSKYCSERFEVTVHFVEREGVDRVMIEVPSGVRTPVICRANIPKAATDKHQAGSLLSEGTVYVRTLASNGRPSSSAAVLSDWSRLMEFCFNNREADIGAFMRRQLSGLDILSASSALSEILGNATGPTPAQAADEFG